MSNPQDHPIIGWMERNPERVEAHLPEGWTPEIAKRNALAILQADQKASGKIAKCTPDSFLLCVLRAASLGLSFDSGHAYIIPYGNVATLSISYMGMAFLAKTSGEIRHLRAEVVYEGERFAFNNSSDPSRRGFDHPISIPRGNGSKNIIAAYVCIDRRDGLTDFEVIDRDEIDAIRSKAASNSGAWKDFFGEMAKKSVIRRALKRYTLQPEIHELFAAEDSITVDFVVGRDVRASASDLNARFLPAQPVAALPAPEPTPEPAQAKSSSNSKKSAPVPKAEQPEPPPQADEAPSVMQSIGQLMLHADVEDDVREAARAFIAGLNVEDQEAWQLALKEADDRADIVREAASKGAAA